MSVDAKSIKQNLDAVHDRIAAAAAAAGRDPDEITLVAVGKLHPAERIEAALFRRRSSPSQPSGQWENLPALCQMAVWLVHLWLQE